MTAAAPPAAAEPAPAPAAARMPSLSATVGTTGRSIAIAARWWVTSRSNAAHASHTATWRRIGARRSALPRSVASCSWISAQSAERACRHPASVVRAWNTSAFTRFTGTSRLAPISWCDRSSSSDSSSAARWSSGSRAMSASISVRPSRRSTSSATARPSVLGSSQSSSSHVGWRVRSIEMHRLRATAYSHGLSWTGFDASSSCRCAATKTCCSASSASSREPSMCRQKPSSGPE